MTDTHDRDEDDPGDSQERPAGPGEMDLEMGRAIVEKHGFLSWLGVSLETLERGRAVLHLPYDEKLTNWVSGTIHGGVTASVIDTSSGFALRTCFDDPLDATLATTDMNVRYLRPATSDLTVEASVVRSGDSMGVTRVDVAGTSPEGDRKPVAIGSTTYRLFPEGLS